MERLTFEGNFCDIAQCRDSACRQDGTCTQRLVWERLKAYEDAGLSPQACAEAREIEETLSGYSDGLSGLPPGISSKSFCSCGGSPPAERHPARNAARMMS